MQSVCVGPRGALLSAACRSARPVRRAAMVVRAAAATEEKVEASTSEPAAATSAPAPSTSSSGAAATLVRPHKPKTVSSLPDPLEVFSFNGSAPEIINGRLAMLGFVAAAGCELFTGQTIGAQAWANFGFVFKLVLLVSAASLATIYRGVRNDEAFGPLTPEAELKNGRMAMIGYGSMTLIELFTGHALF